MPKKGSGLVDFDIVSYADSLDEIKLSVDHLAFQASLFSAACDWFLSVRSSWDEFYGVFPRRQRIGGQINDVDRADSKRQHGDFPWKCAGDCSSDQMGLAAAAAVPAGSLINGL